MTPVFHFVLVVAVQCAALGCVEWIDRSFCRANRHVHSLTDAVVAGLLGGLALGIAFDQFVGAHLHFFSYTLDSPAFSLANGLLSYGVAIATALQFPRRLLPAKDIAAARGLAAMVAASAALAVIYAVAQTPLALAAVAGGIIVLLDEICECYVLGSAGPFLEALSGDLKRPIEHWALSIMLGLIYEGANALFPVWHWWFAGTPMAVLNEAIIIAFGYAVLFHFCRLVGLIFLRLVRMGRELSAS